MKQIFRAVAALLLMTGPAMAQDSNLSISGWLDQSFNVDTNTPGDINPIYSLFEVGTRLSHSINDNFGGFIQLNARWDQTLDSATGNNGSLNILAREAYAYAKAADDSKTLKIGKFYVPIGFELADPPDLFQYSNSNVFATFLPTEAIGFLGAMNLSDTIDLQVYVVGAPTDNDYSMAAELGAPAVGERLGIAIGEGGIGISALYTHDGTNAGDPTLLFDIDGTMPMDNMTIGFEGVLQMDTANDAIGYGVMAMANYGVNDSVSVTGRVDAVLGDVVADPLISITVAPLVNLAPGWDLVFEARADLQSDAYQFGSADPSSMQLTGAAELIYQFNNGS